MSRFGALLITIISCSALVCPPAFALASEYDLNQRIGQQPEWPGGVADLLNSQKPVYAYFVNLQDNFYYSGDAAAFNSFMERYSKLEAVPHTLVLHCGKGEVKAFMEPKTHAFDWHVFVVPPMIPDGGLDKTSPYKRYVTVNLYLGCGIQLSEIKVPGNVTVKPGKEIDGFIRKHEKMFPNTASPPEPSISNFGARPALSPVSIYLAEDETLTALDALKMDLREIKLQWKPLFTLDDFACYSWKDHWFKLTPEALKRLPKAAPPENRLLKGIPFVLFVNGERVYMGAFWTWISSLTFPNPVIVADEMWLPSRLNWLTIDRAYPGWTEEQNEDDIRNSPALQKALEAAGKFEACKGIMRPPPGGFSSTQPLDER
ncbi:MAG: hypothetical protein KBC96_12515 [Armatimonadetes bacterium]|nr:hypothetical protein [Armatimonadota bacterium]